MTFPLIEFLLVCVFLMTIGNFWLWFRSHKNKKHFYHWFVLYLNSYISIHALYVLLIESFFPDIRFLDRLPFALLYGPFLCFIILAQKNGKLSKRTIGILALPFIFLFLWFIALLLIGIPADLVKPYGRALAICSLLSYSCYAAWGIHYVTRHLKHKPFIRKPLLLMGFMLLVMMSSIVLAYILSDGKISGADSAQILLRSMVYSCLLGATYLIYIEFRLIAKLTSHTVEHQKETPETKYEKSLLPQERMDEYAAALDDLMKHDKVYLNQDLSLQKLAELINIPPHHLTQVFNLKIGTSFHEYVNKFRIEEACILLISQKHIAVEIIAQRCGFNSKSSFNRNFKSSQGCSPSEYRSSQK